MARLFVISGPSGVGKGTVVARLVDSLPDLWVSRSVTTRLPRDGERDGVDYYFVDEDRFRELQRHGELLEWATVHGYLYGTPKQAVEQKLREGKDVLLEIDVQGAFQVKDRFAEAVTIFLEPPSLDELERRIVARGKEGSEEVRRRLETARRELAEKDRFDHVVMNDNLEDAVAEVRRIIEESRRESRP